jgi:hypothetical protein
VNGFIRVFGVWGVWVCCILMAQAQAPRLDWRTMPDTASLPDMLQIRLTPAAFQYFGGRQLPSAGSHGLGIPELDSIWHVFGFGTYQRLVDIPLQPSKSPLLPDENNVLRWVRIQVSNKKVLKQALEALEKCTDWVEYAEPVYRTETHHMAGAPFFNDPWIPNDSLFNRQWHYHNVGQTGGLVDADIDLPEAWQIEKGHPSVIVSVMDNGLDTLHPDLRPMLSPLRGYNFFAGNNVLVAGNHANHVGGTIAARTNNSNYVSGIAGGDGENGSGARLVSCQIFGVPNGSGGVENAFVWSAQNGVAISNNSWGYTVAGAYNQSVIDAIDFFIENGGGTVLKKGLVIFSAGNSNDYAQRWPAVYHKVIGVTGTNHRDAKAWYSTYHEMMDIAAPGGELNEFSGGPLVDNGRRGVLSTVTMPNGATGYQQGTSMAAPHVSGVAALIASHGRGRLSADDVKSILLIQSDEIDSYQLQMHRRRMGNGRLNAHNALQLTRNLMQLPEIAPPVFLQAQPECGDILLRWQKHSPFDEVMIAVSTNTDRGGLFGIPSGNLQPGDSLPGGGRVVYKGAASEFAFPAAVEGTSYYFKAWTVGATSYSLGVVTANTVIPQSSIDQVRVVVDCYTQARLHWSFTNGCDNTEVLIAFNTVNDFGIPVGAYQSGDALGTATIIYQGNGTTFAHLLPSLSDSSNLFYRVWAIKQGGIYTAPKVVTAHTPAAIRNAFAKNTLPASVLTGWEMNPCFSGEVLLAVNKANNFPLPEGLLQPGDTLSVGGATIIYKGADVEFLHQNLNANELYFYSIWPILANGVYGSPRTFFARTTCSSEIFALPFRDSISPLSLQGCSFDSMGFRNFTAGPLPRLSIVETGINPSVQPASGKFMLAFNSYDTRETNQVWLTTPPISTLGVGSVDVAFRWYEDGSEFNSDFFAAEGVSVVWSTDNVNWDTAMFFPRITQYGSNGWKYKQVTLPPEAAQLPRLWVRWVFNSRWGFNCYLDEPMVIPTSPKSGDGLFTKGVAQFTTSGGVTHYYDSLQNLLLSIEAASQDVGHVDEILSLGAGGQISPVRLPGQNNYVANPVGWAVTGRYWHIAQWNTPTVPVRVYHYYTPSEKQALETFARAGNNPLLVPGDTFPLMAYTLNGATLTQADPAGGHTDIGVAKQFGQSGFWQYDAGIETDTLHFADTSAFGQWRMTIQEMNTTGGGGMGVGSPRGNGALLPHWITIAASRQLRNTIINWTTGYERYWQMMELEAMTVGDNRFAHLAFIPPIGLPQQGRAYAFTDTRILPNGRYRYRVKAIDILGRTFMSPEVELTVDDVKGLLLFPNPATRGTLNIFSETPMKWLRILDGMGRVVYSAQPGATQFRGQLPALAAGVYYVQAAMQEGIVVQKLFIQQ